MMMNLLHCLVPTVNHLSPPLTEAAKAAKQRAESAWRASHPSYGRAPVRPADLVLAPLTTAWADQLPLKQRPNKLLQRFPRVANRIALCWCDPALSALVLEDLDSDVRQPPRRGFPSEVAAELRCLLSFNETRPASGHRPAASVGGPSQAA